MADSYNELFGLGIHSEDASLEGWWPLQDDAASTTVDDASSNANDGTLQGGDNTEDLSGTGPNGWLSSALHLNGSVDYVAFGDIIDMGTSDLEVGCIFKCDNAMSSEEALIAKGHGSGGDEWYKLSLESTGKIRVSYDNGSSLVTSTGSTDLDDGAWHTVSAAWDRSGNQYGYVGTTSEDDDSIDANDNQNAQDFSVGARESATSTTGQFFDGLICHVWAFSRLLTAGERSQITAGPEPINSVAPVVSGTATVGETLSCTTGTWGLDSPFAGGSNGTVTYAYQWVRADTELSYYTQFQTVGYTFDSDFTDSVGSNDLTDNNTVGSGTGVLSNAADFEADNSEYLNVASATALQGGDADWMGRVWVRLESKPANNMTIWRKWGSGGDREFELRYRDSTDRFQLRVLASVGGAIAVLDADELGSPSTGVWYCIHFWHNYGAGEVGIAVNGGTPDTASHTGGTSAGTEDMEIGGSSGGEYFDGLIDDVIFLKGQGCVMDSAARTADYNSGSGIAFADWGSEDDIAGATGSTYDLVAADAGKYTRCRVRASNDGGYDSEADTYSNFSSIVRMAALTGTITNSITEEHVVAGQA